MENFKYCFREKVNCSKVSGKVVDPLLSNSECKEKAEVSLQKIKLVSSREKGQEMIVVIVRLVVANTIKAIGTEKAAVTITLAVVIAN